MSLINRIEAALEQHFSRTKTSTAPPRLMEAMRHAVFPGGARIRPQLCLAVAKACGEDDLALTNAAAVAIELLHCASLVHDDIPVLTMPICAEVKSRYTNNLASHWRC